MYLIHLSIDFTFICFWDYILYSIRYLRKNNFCSISISFYYNYLKLSLNLLKALCYTFLSNFKIIFRIFRTYNFFIFSFGLLIILRGIYFCLLNSFWNLEILSKLLLVFYPLKLSKWIICCFDCYFFIVLNWTLQVFYWYYFSSYSSVIFMFSYFLSMFSLFCMYLLFSPTNLFCWRIFRFNWFFISSVLLV